VDEVDSITIWLSRLEGTTSERNLSAQLIWERYFQQLVRLARIQLGALPRRATDEEDVVLSAMNSFFQAAKSGRFPKLSDRNDLWRILVTITARKAIAHRRQQLASKRSAARTVAVSELTVQFDSNRQVDLEQALGTEPTPELAAQVADQYGVLLARLRDDSLVKVATDKLEGYTVVEIAERMGCTTRTVERKLARIRDYWTRDLEGIT